MVDRWVGRRLLLAPALLLALTAAAVVSVYVGASPLSPAEVTGAVVDLVRGRATTEHAALVIGTVRLPRTAAALLVGPALAVAGYLLQIATRNPVADPGLLGINAGAAAAVAGGLALLPHAGQGAAVWLGLAGAAVAGIVSHGVAAMGPGGPTPLRLTMAGAVVSAGLQAFTTILLLADRQALDRFRFWMVGSLAGRDTRFVAAMLPWFALGAVLTVWTATQLPHLLLDDDTARGLGVPLHRVRAGLAAAVMVLCGAATALAGPIAFLGLLAPHLARRLVTGPRAVLAVSAALGGLLLLAADIAGRVVLLPGELQTGIVCGLIGAPVLIGFLRTGRVR